MTVDAVIRDFLAETRAKRQYANRCQELFELEDLQRSIGDLERAQTYHEAGRIAGHAAWAEDVDPEP